MIIDILEDYNIKFKKVFNSIVFETEDGEFLSVCMRDQGFEIATYSKGNLDPNWYYISSKGIEDLGGNPSREEKE